MKAGVIGGGAWGTALAQTLAQGGDDVLLWAREADAVAAINTAHENTPFLAGVPLSPTIRATGDLSEMSECDTMLAVVPAQFLRTVLGNAPIRARPLILCAKGIEAGSMQLMSEVARDACPDAPLAVLSGPTFAAEVARGMPTAVTLASEDASLAQTLAGQVARRNFRPYVSTDVIGAEIGGAVKNVLAIACGVVAGCGLGENARAALIARGFAEMTRFGVAKGGRADTLAGLSGLGDLVLTCSSTQSRNFSLGKGLGEGQRAVDLLANRSSVAEGASTAPVLQAAARALGVEMPVVDAVCALLDGSAPVGEIVGGLLARPLRQEN